MSIVKSVKGSICQSKNLTVLLTSGLSQHTTNAVEHYHIKTVSD